MENKEIVDLLSRPIMVELILDALKEIEKISQLIWREFIYMQLKEKCKEI